MNANHPKHEREHRDRLEAILTSDDVQAALRSSGLEDCEACRAAVAWHAELAGAVRELGAEERRELEQARALRGVAGEACVEDVLRGAMGGAHNGRIVGGAGLFRWLPAAAGVLLVAIGAAIWWPRSAPSPELLPGPDIIMGSELVLLGPTGEYDASVCFEWTSEESCVGWFELEIRDSLTGELSPLSRRVREGTSWTPTPEEYGRLPDHAEWRVKVFDPSGGLGSVSGWVRAQRSPD